MEEVNEKFIYEAIVPKNDDSKKKCLASISIMLVDNSSLVKSRTLLKVLFDPGSTKTLIKMSVLRHKKFQRIDNAQELLTCYLQTNQLSTAQ